MPEGSSTNPDKVFQPADFFVSYTGVDEVSAEWIAWVLEEAGYTVIFQKWDFRPGNNFPLLMHSALKQASHVVAVLSPAYLEAGYPGAEWAGAFVDDPTGMQRRLIPVLLKPCRPDGLLHGIIHIDLSECLRMQNKEDARERLLAGVRGGRAKPSVEPDFPSAEEGGRTI